MKFLSARKFNVERAVELLRNHESVRHREGLTNFQPTLSPLREELETAKFTVLPWRDSQVSTPISDGVTMIRERQIGNLGM